MSSRNGDPKGDSDADHLRSGSRPGRGVTVDLDEPGNPVGVEVLDASVGLGREALERVVLARLPRGASTRA